MIADPAMRLAATIAGQAVLMTVRAMTIDQTATIAVPVEMTERKAGSSTMNRPSNGKRPTGRNAGTNTLITAASLALTLSGWAVLATNEAEPAPVVVSVPTQTPQPLPSLAAVPTLVPEPDWTSLTPPTAMPAARLVPTAVVAPPQAAAAPARLAQPPRPAAVTRSSR